MRLETGAVTPPGRAAARLAAAVGICAGRDMLLLVRAWSKRDGGRRKEVLRMEPCAPDSQPH
ncbi:hypothetical protein ACFZDK_16570 [Streptomyces sp. NPDC007901]|uniref:hypothetical protein n=1 Tax=Streptomyces sp. NPDC007901 TaxID=3364785 RepID=UPI0036E4BE75